MRNRSAIWVFTILLTLACLYQLSLSWVTGGVEQTAKNTAVSKLDEIKNDLGDQVILGRDTLSVSAEGLTTRQELDVISYYEAQYISEHADDAVYPVLGLSYKKCKNQQLTKGLDLQGGMSVTLEISIPELVKKKAANSPTPQFQETYKAALDKYRAGAGDDFVELFFETYNEGPYKAEKMKFFAVAAASSGEFTMEMTQDEVKAKLQKQAEGSIEAAKTVIEQRVNRFGLGQIIIQTEPLSGRLHIEIPGAKDKEGVRNMLQSQAKLEFWNGYDKNLQDAFLQIDAQLKGSATKEVVETVKETVADSTYLTEELRPYIRPGFVVADSLDSMKVEEANKMIADAKSLGEMTETDVLPEDDVVLDGANANAIFDGKFIFTQTPSGNSFSPSVGYALSSKDTSFISITLASDLAQGNFTENVKFFWSYKAQNEEGMGMAKDEKHFVLYAAKSNEGNTNNITGDDIKSAAYYTLPSDQGSGMAVTLKFHNDNGAVDKWADWTGSSKGKFVGITLDNVVYSFPIINDAITGGNTEISGNFSFEEAEQLAAILEAGALPAPARIADESVIGATLSEANIDKGFWSFIIALVLVLVYMSFYYAKAGVVASIALVANLFFIIGTLASLGAALTLPGIAGLVLTIGMSVDANVLIFERIREELRNGKMPKQAIADGYKAAYSAILDSNITSLLTAIILAYFGSGPIQGFATTLIIGVFSSLFCSIFITRLIFSHMSDRKMNITFSNTFSEKVFKNANYDFMKGRKKYYFISGAIVIAGMISLFSVGMDKSVEFTGGRSYTFSFSEAPDQDELKAAVEKFSIEKEGDKGVTPVVKQVNGATQYNISTNYLYGSALDTEHASAQVDSVLNLALNDLGYFATDSDEVVNGTETKTYNRESQRSVSALISNELMFNSFVAIALSLLVVFLYIGFRFSRWQYGLGALIAMAHDVMVVLGIFSILYALKVPLNIEIDQAFIAAILTVIGYSINDTVVIYDRIREFIGLHKRDDQDKVINAALNTTLSRTINTSLTTFMVLLIIFIFGGDGIAGFSLALLIGVAVGTYSSIFIAAPSVVEFTKNLMPVSKPADKK